jgi:branched-chain amino acid aminotransferase
VLTLAPELGVKPCERPISLQELIDASKTGALKEVFGCGSAAVISPIGELAIGGGETIIVNRSQTGTIAKALFDEITGIQYGARPDTHGWLEAIP